MKSIFILALASICLFTILSCTKTTTQTIVNNDTTTILTRDTLVVMNPINPIVGYWVGTLTANNEPAAGNLYYSFDIRADSSILITSEGADGNTYYNQGTWTMTDSSFKATTVSTTNGNSGILQTITAIYSKPNGKLYSGIWKNQNGTAEGTFILARVN